MPGPAVEAAAKGGGHHHHHEGHGCGGKAAGKWEKTYLDVLGICCTAEVALVERLLSPIHGVRAVTVVVPSRTIIVDHDTGAVSQFHIGNQKKSLVTFDCLPTLSSLPVRARIRESPFAHFPDQ
jgi:Cd2+/Zn2+-exporting ATPase